MKLEPRGTGERQFRAPRVAAQLVRRARVGLDRARRLFGFGEKFARAADAKRIIGRLGRAANLERIFVDDFFVLLCPTLGVHHIPAERLKKWIEKFAAQLRFLVLHLVILIEVARKKFDAFADDAFRLFEVVDTHKRKSVLQKSTKA